MLSLIQAFARRDRLMRLASPVFGAFNPWHPDNRRDPYRFYKSLRDTPGLARSRLLGLRVASRYEDVQRALRDPAFGNDRTSLLAYRTLRLLAYGDADFLSLVERNLMSLNPPKHTRVRAMAGAAFAQRNVLVWEDRVEDIANELLDAAFSGTGVVDFVAEFAEPLPLIVMAEWLGAPASDRMRFKNWAIGLGDLLDPVSGEKGIGRARAAARDLSDYFRALIRERRRVPREDLISSMIAVEEADEELCEADVVAFCGLVLAAGHETVTDLLGNLLVCLTRYPDEHRRLQDDPKLLPKAIEEVLRFESPIQLTERVVKESCEMAGVRLVPGNVVVTLIGSANRDPEYFDSPDRFDITRSNNPHLAFGFGTHYCLGVQLARLEARVALEVFFRRFGNFRSLNQPLSWKRTVVLRGPSTLPIQLGI